MEFTGESSNSSSDLDEGTESITAESGAEGSKKSAYSSPVKKLLKSRVNKLGFGEVLHKSVGIRGQDGRKGCGDVTELKARVDDVHLVHVEYPGIVENPARAIRTLGGMVKISEAFQNPHKRLELRYRPADPFCNPAHGVGRTTVGLLIKVRRRKERPSERVRSSVQTLEKNVKQIDLDAEDPDLPDVLEQIRVASEDPINRISDKTDDQPPSDDPSLNSCPGSDANATPVTSNPSDILGLPDNSKPEELEEEWETPYIKNLTKQELDLQKQKRIENEMEGFNLVEQDGKGELLDNVKTVIRLPSSTYNPPKSNFRMENLGIITKTFDFTGVSDYQYLPTASMITGDRSQVCVSDNIFPGFGDPDNGILFDYEDPTDGNVGKQFFPFSLPGYLSRIEKPVAVPKIYYSEDAVKQEESQGDSVESTRSRRSVYTHTIHFNEPLDPESLGTEIPKEPYAQALEDAAKKFFEPKRLQTVRAMFDERPIWTKSALEWRTKYTTETLKYLLPCVAYFTLNGPWRSLWIRFGYDPRKDKTAFAYQLIDFRFPLEYRTFLEIDQDDKESYYKFKPSKIPPKSQMFYQLCDIKIPEIEELQGSLTVRLNSSAIVPYDTKFGFLDEDIMEFCRYCMSRCIEIRLFSLGKISTIKLPPISLEPGGFVPVDQLKIKPRKPAKKRIRQPASSRSRPKKSSVPQVANVTYEFPNEVNIPPGHNLTDYFDDDDMEEEDVEMYDGNDYEGGLSGRLDECFEQDETEDEEET